MKQVIFLVILIVLIAGCTTVDKTPIQNDSVSVNTTITLSGTQDLILDEKDLQQLGIEKYPDNQDLLQAGMLDNGSNCHTEKDYSNIVDSSLGQYSICSYIIRSLNDTEVIIELQTFADYEALNGSYQYSSSHLLGAKGFFSENELGDQSKFHVNSEDDYGAEFDKSGLTYYHLWFTKDLYMVHITSKGSDKDAKDYIAKTGRQILEKFG